MGTCGLSDLIHWVHVLSANVPDICSFVIDGQLATSGSVPESGSIGPSHETDPKSCTTALSSRAIERSSGQLTDDIRMSQSIHATILTVFGTCAIPMLSRRSFCHRFAPLTRIT